MTARSAQRLPLCKQFSFLYNKKEGGFFAWTSEPLPFFT